jgi:two-component sensor histidine kinase
LALSTHSEADIPVDLVGENADLRAALAFSEDAGIQRELVTQELKHRIGNLLILVAAIARKTFRHADANSVADFTARLGALTAAQKLLIDAETHPAALADVIEQALSPHQVGGRCNASGPGTMLSGRRATHSRSPSMNWRRTQPSTARCPLTTDA